MLAQMLAPAAVLILWSLVMLFWLAGTRFPALAKLGVKVSNAPPGVRGQDSEDQLPPSVNWKSHNYTHLMEQPTIFYPTVLVLALLGLSSARWDAFRPLSHETGLIEEARRVLGLVGLDQRAA